MTETFKRKVTTGLKRKFGPYKIISMLYYYTNPMEIEARCLEAFRINKERNFESLEEYVETTKLKNIINMYNFLYNYFNSSFIDVDFQKAWKIFHGRIETTDVQNIKMKCLEVLNEGYDFLLRTIIKGFLKIKHER